MKLFVTILLLTLGFSGMAQHYGFVRIFDLQGKKIYKGHVIGITDSSLILKHNVTFKVTEIGKIKTKRSAGHNVALGTLIGLVALTTVGVISDNPYRDTDLSGLGATIGLVYGPIFGAIGGFISVIFKNPQMFEINGSLENWQVFKEALEK